MKEKTIDIINVMKVIERKEESIFRLKNNIKSIMITSKKLVVEKENGEKITDTIDKLLDYIK